MSRMLAIVVVLAFPAMLLPQEPPWVEQFDGKTLQGWEIDGDSTVENGSIRLGGKRATTLRLTAPLGTHYQLRLEYKLTGAGKPILRWPAAGFAEQLSGGPDQWMEFNLKVTQGTLFRGNQIEHSDRAVDGGQSGSGRMSGGWGSVREVLLVVPEGTTLTIRHLSLQTTPPTPPGASHGALWAALAVLVLVLVGIMVVGWFLRRRRSSSAGPAGT